MLLEFQEDAYEEISNLIAEFVTSLPTPKKQQNEEYTPQNVEQLFEEATDGHSDHPAVWKAQPPVHQIDDGRVQGLIFWLRKCLVCIHHIRFDQVLLFCLNKSVPSARRECLWLTYLQSSSTWLFWDYFASGELLYRVLTHITWLVSPCFAVPAWLTCSVNLWGTECTFPWRLRCTIYSQPDQPAKVM